MLFFLLHFDNGKGSSVHDFNYYYNDCESAKDCHDIESSNSMNTIASLENSMMNVEQQQQ